MHAPLRRARQGFGIVLLFVVGVIVVLVVFLMSQYFTGRAATQEVASSDLSHRATIVAESATEECAFFTMTAANAVEPADEASKELYEGLRTFESSTDPTPRIEGPSGKGLPYRFDTTFDVPQTKGFYSDPSRTGDVTVSSFTIGVLQQSTFPDKPVKGNETYGILGFEGEVTVKSEAGGRDVNRVVQSAKDFRVLLLHPPYPFNKYTLYVKRPSVGTADRFHSYFERYEALADATLPPFPVADMASDERPVVTTAPGLSPETFVIRGLDPATPAAAADRGQLAAQMGRMALAGFHKLPADEATEYVNGNYYKQLQWETLRSKASHVYDNFARFVHDVSEGGELKLSGMYYIERGVAVDHTFSGRGVVVTTSPEGVRVRQCRRADPGGRLVIIAAKGDIVIDTGGATGLTVDADLYAPEGTVKDAGGVKINGIVHVAYLPPGSSPGPWIVRPPDTETEPWTAGGTLDPDYARKLGVFLTPGYAWKRTWNVRE